MGDCAHGGLLEVKEASMADVRAPQGYRHLLLPLRQSLKTLEKTKNANPRISGSPIAFRLFRFRRLIAYWLCSEGKGKNRKH